jgi:hypothetical protein
LQLRSDVRVNGSCSAYVPCPLNPIMTFDLQAFSLSFSLNFTMDELLEAMLFAVLCGINLPDRNDEHFAPTSRRNGPYGEFHYKFRWLDLHWARLAMTVPVRDVQIWPTSENSWLSPSLGSRLSISRYSAWEIIPLRDLGNDFQTICSDNAVRRPSHSYLEIAPVR